VLIQSDFRNSSGKSSKGSIFLLLFPQPTRNSWKPDLKTLDWIETGKPLLSRSGVELVSGCFTKTGPELLFDSLQMLFVLLPLRQRTVQFLPNFVEQRKLFQILGVER
jgi:hypothetical protein